MNACQGGNLALTAWELFAENLRLEPSRVAIVDGNHAHDYAAVALRVASYVGWLRDLGVARGDRVGICLRKSTDEVAAQLAAWCVGAVAVNVSAQWTVAQLEYVMQDCSVRALLCDGKRATELAQRPWPRALQRVLSIGGQAVHDRIQSAAALPQATCAPTPTRIIDSDLAAILYTSGSTGAPKGVMVTHANLVLGARSVAQYLRLRSDDRILSLLPLCFDYGLNQLLTACLMGARLVLQAVPMPSEVAKTIARAEVTDMAAVPPAWVQLVRYLDEVRTPLPSLRLVTNSGGKIPPAVLDGFTRVFPGTDVVLMYGLTEAFRSTWLPPEKFARKPGCMGGPIPNVETWIIAANGSICGPGEQGELVHRGPLISRGYWGRPDDTAEKIRPCPALAHLIGDEPVVYSGDIVRIDDDGDYWFVSRADAMLKSSGYRISPTEIEDLAFASGQLAEVVAFGVDDDLLGQAVHLAVVGRDGAEVDLEALGRHVRAHMPHYMQPREIHCSSQSFPRTASGKIDRPAVIEQCLRARS